MNKNKIERFSLGLIGCLRLWTVLFLLGFLRQVQKVNKFCLSKNSLAFPFRNIQVCFLLFDEESIQICGKTVEENRKLVNSSLAATSTGNLVFKGRTCELDVTFENFAKTTTRSLHLNWFPVFCFCCLGKPCKATLGPDEEGVMGWWRVGWVVVNGQFENQSYWLKLPNHTPFETVSFSGGIYINRDLEQAYF